MNKWPRQGLGYDVHELVEGRRLVLGGLEIPFERGLLGHSDADVLTHAVMDALCGALCLGDIGKLFPDTDPQYKDIYSMTLLAHIVAIMEQKGYEIGNVDAVVCAQRPKLRPYIDAMRERLAEVLHTSVGQVNLKATTTEHLGFVGREEGIESFATVMIVPKPAQS